MFSDDTGINKDQRILAFFGHGIAYRLPNTPLGPAVIPITHRRSGAIVFRQVPPVRKI